jgi:hypothetical protein
MEQLKSDFYAQNWDALYGMADPEDQLHAPLCRYIISTDEMHGLPLTSKKLWSKEILLI